MERRQCKHWFIHAADLIFPNLIFCEYLGYDNRLELILFLQPITRGQTKCNNFIFGNAGFISVPALSLWSLYQPPFCDGTIPLFLKIADYLSLEKKENKIFCDGWCLVELWSMLSSVITITCAQAVTMAMLIQTETGSNSATEKPPESRKPDTECKNEQEGTDGNSERRYLHYV